MRVLIVGRCIITAREWDFTGFIVRCRIDQRLIAAGRDDQVGRCTSVGIKL